MSSESINNLGGSRDGGEAGRAGSRARDRREGGDSHASHLEPELLDLARSLDARGSSIVGGRDGLSSESLERIFAASDMQLPLAPAPVAGKIGRGAPAASFARLLRIAAVVAAAAGMGVAVYVVTRSFEDAPNPLKNGSVAPQGTIAQAPERREPAATAVASSESAAPRLRARDLDTALSGALAARTTVRPSAGAVLAMSGGVEASGDEAAGAFDGEYGGEYGGDIDGAFAALDASSVTFDELSGEFSALLAASGAVR